MMSTTLQVLRERSATSGPVTRIVPTLLLCLSLLAGVAACERAAPSLADGPPKLGAAQLKAATKEDAVRKFYEARQWRAAWSRRDAAALLDALKAAPRHGLDASRFTGMIRDADAPAARDVELTQAALTYADALAKGVVDPKTLHAIYAIERPKYDAPGQLEGALRGHSVGQWLEGLSPHDADYRRLSEAYLAYAALVASPIPAGAPLQPGASDARTAALGRWLTLVGFLPGDPANPASVYDGRMVAALRALQKSAGLPATGQADPATVKVMNDAAALRAKQVAVNLERRRWLPRDVPATRIDVNTAAAVMTYLRGGQPIWNGRVVVGDPDAEHQTPQLMSAFDQLVVNPPWIVPEGIAAKEILPKGQAYLDRENMRIEDGKVIQQAGPTSALGLVKFDMQNPHAIYLHDTPSKALFAADERHRSHGCARVERAVEFARLLSQERGRQSRFDEALATGETQAVSLGEKIPVRLLYLSAYVDDAGKLAFTDDRYGWDDLVSGALGLGALATPRSQAPVAHLLGP